VKLTYLLATLPFLGLLGGMFLADRVEPFVLGMPFILFWILTWTVLTSLILARVYVLDPANREDETE